MSLWTAEAVARATQGRLLNAETAGPINGVSIDTRGLVPGDLFIALRGPPHDSHDFARAAA